MIQKSNKNSTSSANLYSSESEILIRKKDLETNPLDILHQFIQIIKKDYKVSEKEISSIFKTELPVSQIPITIFNNNQLTAFETLVKYLRENYSYTFDKIANELNRGKTTIVLTYNRAHEKLKKKIVPEPTEHLISLNKFSNRDFSIQEILVSHLKSKSLSNHEIAEILNRDDRTIWTVYNRYRLKNEKKK